MAVPIAANGMRALGIIVLAHLEGSAAAVEADHVLYGWLFFTLVIIILIAIGMTFAQKIARRIPIRVRSDGRSLRLGDLPSQSRRPSCSRWPGPAYAARLNALYPPSPLAGGRRRP